MKKNLFMLTVAAILIVAASCKSKSQRDAENYMNKIDETMKENSPDQTQQKTNTSSAAIPQGMENIVGEWELVKMFGDDNGNHVIDNGEENDPIPDLKEYLKLNANGTCEYTIAKLEGRYEIVPQDDGSKKLVMYDRTGAKTMTGRYIISVTDKEMVINRLMAGSSFEIFKRI